jgi:hypothetical protein
VIYSLLTENCLGRTASKTTKKKVVCMSDQSAYFLCPLIEVRALEHTGSTNSDQVFEKIGLGRDVPGDVYKLPYFLCIGDGLSARRADGGASIVDLTKGL